MAKHRGLSLKKFIFEIPWYLIERYFAQLQPQATPTAWTFLNPHVLEQFLNDPENAEASPFILEDFQRINDLGGHSVRLLLRACERSGIECDREESSRAWAMRLFLDDREGFEYGWTLYLLTAQPTKTYDYHFPAGPLQVNDEDIENLRSFLRGCFLAAKKGHQCRVVRFDTDGQLLIRVSRGSYLKTVARWRGNEVEFETFRPASEDIIVYDPSRSRCSVKCANRREREQYLRGVAGLLAHTPALADEAITFPVFSLEPFRDGTFNYGGYGAVARVWLIEADLRLPTAWAPVLRIKVDDIMAALRDDLSFLRLDGGDLLRVKLRFRLQLESEKRPREVNVEIEPPGFSDLAQRAQAALIESYLRDQKVKLV